MLYIGDKVRFIHTLTEGEIVDRLEDGLFIIEIERGLEVPASEELLNKIQRQEIPKTSPSLSQEINVTGEGILVAFEKQSGLTPSYGIYLINDTPYKAIFDFKIHVKGLDIKPKSDIVNPRSTVFISAFLSDYLSDNPRIEISCRQISTEGEADWLHKELKVKPKNFFSKQRVAPVINREAYVYSLFEPLAFKKQLEDLRQYTQKNVQKKQQENRIKEKKNEQYRTWKAHDVNRFADFPREKDLHIEKLVKDPHKMEKSDILQTQLKAFSTYLDQAIRIGVERVFVIHGKGKGILRSEIAQRLRLHPNVKDFKNEHHPKYGTGATEIILH